jgi:RNA polymerase sigma-70 factor (ECF subfamily)
VDKILKLSKRKTKAIERQILSHLDSLYFGALKLTGHREDAEDLVQETYHKALDHVDQLRDQEKGGPWLYKIMINTWKNWRTRRFREFSSGDQEQWETATALDTGDNPDSHQLNPEEDLIIKESWRAVESVLAHLPPNYRMAVILSDIEGFSYREIAGIMEWPAGTVMSRLSRARRLMARRLKRYRDGE